MVDRRTRLVASSLALALLATTGCVAPALTAAPGGAKAAASAFAALGVPDAKAGEATLYGAIFRDLDRDGDGAVAAAEARGSWLEAELQAMDGDRDGRFTRAEAERFFLAQAPRAERAGSEGFGLVGAIGAGAVGVGLAGYLTYTGLKGSHDLMFPKKETFAKPPSEFGMPYEEVAFKSHDGLKLVGWYVPASAPTTRAIMIFHGHGSNKDAVFEKYALWLQDDYNLFVYDQRYSGQSEGKSSSLGPYEVKDAVLAVEQVRARGNTRIGFMGESMGGAVAVGAAPLVPDVRAVWSDCAYSSQFDAIEPRARARKYPLSVPVTHSVIKTASLRLGTDLTAVDPVKWAAKIAPRPLYVVHGMADDETTPVNAEKLFAAAHEPKAIWRVEGAKHAQSYKVAPVEYRERLRTFFDEAL